MKEGLAFIFLTVLWTANASVLPGADAGHVRLKGELGRRLESMIRFHVGGADVDYITAPFLEKTERNGWWQTEFWGKFMHSAVPYSIYSGSKDLRRRIEYGVDRILGSQEPCGYIGNYPEELRCGEGWDVWGMKYTLMGLLHYYDGEMVREEKSERALKALNAAKRLCDYVIAEIGPKGRKGYELWTTGNWSGYASSSILEPVLWLYKRTGDSKYLDFATYLVEGMTEREDGPRLLDLALEGVSVADRNKKGAKLIESHGGYVIKHNRWKAYEMMSCYQGFLEYFQATGRRDLFDAAVKSAEDIVREEVNLAGGCAASEAWFHGARKQHLPYLHLQETCVTTTWMRFCEKLLEITDDPKWADQIERTFYNAYLGAMKIDGAEFAGYTPLSGDRYHGQHHCYMHTDCCTANGPRGFLSFLRPFFLANEKGVTINFYSSALMSSELPNGKKVAFDLYSLYPRDNMVRLVSHTEGVGSFPLRMRIPGWCPNVSVKLNGQVVDSKHVNGYCVLNHAWRLGDVVEIAFEMPVVAHKAAHHLAFTRGPILLARDSRFADGNMNDVYRQGIADGQVMESFRSVRSPSDEVWMTYSATLPLGGHHENPEGANETTVFFCDYASAGNTWTRDNYYQTWYPEELRPTD